MLWFGIYGSFHLFSCFCFFAFSSYTTFPLPLLNPAQALSVISVFDRPQQSQNDLIFAIHQKHLTIHVRVWSTSFISWVKQVTMLKKHMLSMHERSEVSKFYVEEEEKGRMWQKVRGFNPNKKKGARKSHSKLRWGFIRFRWDCGHSDLLLHPERRDIQGLNPCRILYSFWGYSTYFKRYLLTYNHLIYLLTFNLPWKASALIVLSPHPHTWNKVNVFIIRSTTSNRALVIY